MYFISLCNLPSKISSRNCISTITCSSNSNSNSNNNNHYYNLYITYCVLLLTTYFSTISYILYTTRPGRSYMHYPTTLLFYFYI